MMKNRNIFGSAPSPSLNSISGPWACLVILKLIQNQVAGNHSPVPKMVQGQKEDMSPPTFRKQSPLLRLQCSAYLHTGRYK